MPVIKEVALRCANENEYHGIKASRKKRRVSSLFSLLWAFSSETGPRRSDINLCLALQCFGGVLGNCFGSHQCSVQAELFLPLPFCHPIPPVLPLTPVAATVAEYRKPSKTLGFSHKP